jgi:hypothetical protein
MTAPDRHRTAARPRRHLPTALAPITAAAVLLLATAAGAAPQQAPPDQTPGPPGAFQWPQVGDEVRLEVLDAKLLLRPDPGDDRTEQTLSTGSMRGDLSLRVTEVDPVAGKMGLDIDNLYLSTDEVPETDDPGAAEQHDLGKVTIELDPEGERSTSTLTMTSQFPPAFEHAVVLDLKMTIENPPAPAAEASPGAAPESPLVLTTEQPLRLDGELTSFPPTGQTYQSPEPVNLVDLANPNGDLPISLFVSDLIIG